jgi:hypothetical protein
VTARGECQNHFGNHRTLVLDKDCRSDFAPKSVASVEAIKSVSSWVRLFRGNEPENGTPELARDRQRRPQTLRRTTPGDALRGGSSRYASSKA